MPFTPEDADKHKKGLSDKKKKQWARVAESIRLREMKKGKSEKEAAGEAVKQANGVVNVNASETYSVYKSKQKLNYEPKLTVHQDNAHLVIPVVMMVEGVHHGSQGALLHSIDDLGKFPASWDGRPVVINHPDIDGVPVSANQPEIIDTQTVGRVYNTNVDGKKLKAEVWLDEDKLNTLSEQTWKDIQEGLEVEVSLGMFTENEMVEGKYGDEDYVGIARNHRPDHLAILPDQVGACSCKDGCGLGANQNNENMTNEEMIASLRKEGFSIAEIGVNLSGSYNERMKLVRELIEGYNTDKIWNYLEDMDDMFFVYSQNGHKENKLLRQEYRFESGKITLVDEPVEVHKKVDYIVNSNLKKEDTMSKNECPKCLEKVNTLIANGVFAEEDREMLSNFNEAQLDKLFPKEKVVEKTIEVNKLTPEQQADLAYVAKQRAEKRNEMIQGIQANTSKEVWPDEMLNAMNEDTLSRLFNSVRKEEKGGNFVFNAGAPINVNKGEEEPLYPAGVTIK